MGDQKSFTNRRRPAKLFSIYSNINTGIGRSRHMQSMASIISAILILGIVSFRTSGCKPRQSSSLSDSASACVGLADCGSAFVGTYVWKMDVDGRVADSQVTYERFFVVERLDPSNPYTFAEIVNEHTDSQGPKRSRFLRGTMAIVNNEFIVLSPQYSSCSKVPKHARIDKKLMRLGADRLALKTSSHTQSYDSWVSDKVPAANADLSTANLIRHGFIAYTRVAAKPAIGSEACF
jgi:hypothetical protein